jgi:hypothetical protein
MNKYEVLVKPETATNTFRVDPKVLRVELLSDLNDSICDAIDKLHALTALDAHKAGISDYAALRDDAIGLKARLRQVNGKEVLASAAISVLGAKRHLATTAKTDGASALSFEFEPENNFCLHE